MRTFCGLRIFQMVFPMTASRRRWSFSRRKLLVVLTLISVLMSHSAYVMVRRYAKVAAIELRGGRVFFSHPAGYESWGGPLPAVPWYRVILGDRPVYFIHPPPALSDAERQAQECEIHDWFPEATITTH